MIDRYAYFSPDRKYRYQLTRIWHQHLPLAMCIGLNPSTANEAEDDPTISLLYRKGCGVLFDGEKYEQWFHNSDETDGRRHYMRNLKLLTP